MSEPKKEFMDGRNGMDELNWFLFVCLAVVALIAVLWRNYAPLLTATVLLLIILWRALSRKTVNRQRANAPFRQLKNAIVQRYKLNKLRFRDRKTHVYKVCPACHAVLRFKRRKGEKTVTCPYCQNTYTFVIRRKGEEDKA